MNEQDRAELADPARRQQVGAEAGAQLAAVAQDRDQGADRGRRHRRARIERGDDEVEGREHGAGGVGDHDREPPSGRAELQRPPADPLEVDLIAGEEEEHAEAEVGEEFDEAVFARDVEHVGADQDPEAELDDDHRRHEAAGDEGHRGRGDGGHEDDDEEGLGVDGDQGGKTLWARPGRIPCGPC